MMEKETEYKKMDLEDRRILDASMEAGHILLQNGAEIFRVEETMERICRYYGVKSGDFFVLSNGIFTTGGHGTDRQYARVQHIPVRGAQLDKVVAVNQLSREIEEGKYEKIEDVEKKLEEIRKMPAKKKRSQILASGIGSGCFCLLFGGSPAECLAAFLAGLLLYVFVLEISVPHLSKIIGNICGGALVTLVCIVCYQLGIGEDLSHMISGAIIPLVPGVAFANGIRDIGDGDYISGAVRMLDAILVFLCIAIGVGVMFSIYHRVVGGVLL
ncbi:MAG: threonine/serine exporter ThrE family protein [Lachnospiraceae bacterium]